MNSNEEIAAAIDARLVESGEKDKLKEYLRLRLLECGWRDQVKLAAKNCIREHKLRNVKLEDIIEEITPDARASVPDSVKRDLIAKIQEFISKLESL